MRLLASTALALALAAGASAAMAQNNDDAHGHHEHGSGKGGNGGGGQKGGNGGAPQARVQGQQFQGAQQQFHHEGGQGGQQWQGRVEERRHFEGGAVGGQHFQGPVEDRRRFDGGVVAGPNGSQVDQRRHFEGGAGVGQPFNGGRSGQWRGAPDRFGFHEHGLRGRDQGRGWYQAGEYRQHFQAERRFRVGFFARPSGWYYRSWGYGMFLPWGWFAPEYYLDWQDYGLPPPPIGCEWVREGPDAVLVDIWTGEVLSVYSGLFYY